MRARAWGFHFGRPLQPSRSSMRGECLAAHQDPPINNNFCPGHPSFPASLTASCRVVHPSQRPQGLVHILTVVAGGVVPCN